MSKTEKSLNNTFEKLVESKQYSTTVNDCQQFQPDRESDKDNDNDGDREGGKELYVVIVAEEEGQTRWTNIHWFFTGPISGQPTV